ncbi:TPA: hypothetical protein ACG1UU_000080 [Kluyvera ascorbata]
MMAETIVCTLFWYAYVGWCTSELHRHSGFGSRYSGAKYWVSWVVMFLCWPVALPLYVASVKGQSNGEVYDD